MRSTDIKIFSLAAKDKYWILVRITNDHSLKYVGIPGYIPKGMDCKAKTATKDVRPYELKGLVVSPKIHPDAFDNERLTDTIIEWEQMKIDESNRSVTSSQYKIEQNQRSKHYGCLLYNSKYIHGDYDLFDIIDIKQPSRNLALHTYENGKVHRVVANFYKIQSIINNAIGVDMIKHGAEAQYQKFENLKEQSIDAFGPNGEYVTILNKYSLEAWYRDRFGGRQFLG